MLYLIDTINGRDQLLNHPITKFYDKTWRNDALQGADHFGETQVVVMTYAKFGSIVMEYPNFGDTFTYILCDEIHNLPRFCAFINDDPSAPKMHQQAWNRLISIVNKTNVIVVGLSATPRILLSNDSFTVNQITVDEDVRRYETFNTEKYNNVDLLLKKIPKGKKTLLYVSRIKNMKRIASDAEKLGLSVIAIWSTKNTDHPMTDKQHNARFYILKNSELPAEYDLVIINASCETSINLYGQIDNIIIDTKEEETQVQVRGRYRHDLENLYLLDYSVFPEVPEEFLNKELFADQKKTLCETLKLRSEQGTILKWPSVKVALIEHKYTIIEKRFQNRRYSVILKA